MTSNKHSDDCNRCGARVPAGAGKRIRHGDAWVTVHEDCEQTQPDETPLWAVYVPSNATARWAAKKTGVYFVHGDKPSEDAVPMNDAAQAMEVSKDG